MFSISQLEQFSGIKAHTIRIWEQRYNALKPNRSEGNTRYYDDSQLRRLLNIVSLMNSGYTVSELCGMPDKKLFKIVDEKLNTNTGNEAISEYFVSQLITAGMFFDESHFEKIFSSAMMRFGLKDAYIKVIYPLLLRMGLMWAIDKMPPSKEHFITNLIRQKLFTAIDSLPPAKSSKDIWVLFLPENEFHEIGLLFSHYLIRQSGKKVIYLGTNVPLSTLANAAKEIKPTHLLFFLVKNNIPGDSQLLIKELTKYFIKTKMHVSGNEKLISQLNIGKNIQWLKSVEEFTEILL